MLFITCVPHLQSHLQLARPTVHAQALPSIFPNLSYSRPVNSKGGTNPIAGEAEQGVPAFVSAWVVPPISRVVQILRR